MTEQFPPDEFDEIAKRGGPVGVHRAPRPWWSRLLGPVLIFLIAGAAAYLVANYMWNQEVDTPEDPTPTISQTVESTVTSSPQPTNSAPPSSEPSASPEPSETAVVDFDASIAVLNGSGISGLAAKQQTVLKDGGFTDVSADNLTVAKPDANVVVYTSEDLKATAEEVAKQLGIDLISLDVTQTDAVVEVHLVSDPS